MKEPRRAIENALIGFLTPQAPTVDFFANDGDNTRSLPFCVVMCKELEPLVGGIKSNAYRASVKIVYVSHIDDQINAADVHAEEVKFIERGLEQLSTPYQQGSIYINGLAIESLESASEEQSFANVISCVVGFEETADYDSTPA